MEFEHNAPTTPQDIARAAAPRVTLQPLNTIQPSSSNSPGMIDPATRRTFEFEKETTVAPSDSAGAVTAHRLAIGFAVGIAILFVAALVAFTLLR